MPTGILFVIKEIFQKKFKKIFKLSEQYRAKIIYIGEEFIIHP